MGIYEVNMKLWEKNYVSKAWDKVKVPLIGLAFTGLSLFPSKDLFSQSKVNGTFLGNVKSELGIPLENSTMTLKQLVDYDNLTFAELGSAKTDADGNFRIDSDNVTDVEESSGIDVQSGFKAYTNNNKLFLSENANILIEYYNMIGEKIGDFKIDNAKPGFYDMQLPKNIANQVIFRRILMNDDQMVQKLMYLNGVVDLHSDGQIKKESKSFIGNDAKTFNKVSSVKNYSTDSLYFKIMSTLNGYEPDSALIAVKDDGLDVFVSGMDLVQEKIKEYISGQFQIQTQNSATQQGLKTEVKTLERIHPYGNYQLVSTDTTDELGQLYLVVDSLDNTYKNTAGTKLMKFIFKVLEGNYDLKGHREAFPVTNNQITGSITANIEENIVEPIKIPLTVRNFLHQNKEGIDIYVENQSGEKLVFTSDANGKVLLNVPEDFGTRVKMYFKDRNNPDSMYINFQAIQDSINFGKKNLFNAVTKDTVSAQGYPDKKILNYINADLQVMKNKVDEGDPLVYKILERFSDASYLSGYNGVYDMTNTDHVGMLNNGRVGFNRKMDANIVDTLYIITSNKVQHDQHGTNEDIPQRDIDVRDEWLNDWQYLINEPLDGWKNMHMKIVYVADVYNDEQVKDLENKYNLSNFIRVYFADDQDLGNFSIFTNDHVFQRGVVYNRTGGTSIWGMGSELAGQMVLQEEENGDFTFHSATAAKDITGAGKPWRGTRMTNTGDKLRKLMDNIDQGYKFPWKKYSSRN